MAQAARDQNYVTSLLGVSTVDFATPTTAAVEPTYHWLAVGILDDSGNQITSFGGSTQYEEDSQHTTGDTGTMALVVRNDTLASLVGTDGDYAPLQVNASGALYIQQGSALDVSAETVTVDTELPSASALSDTFSNPTAPAVGAFLMGWDGLNWNRVLNAQGASDNVSEDDKGIATNARGYYYDGSAWDRARGDSTNGLLVDLGGNNDVIQSTHDNFNANANVQQGDSDVGSGNPLEVTLANGSVPTVETVGTVADDATTPGDPVMIGGTAKTPDGTDPGNVSAEDDVARFITDLNRRLYVNTEHPFHWSFHSDGSSALTDQSVQSDPGDGFEIVITEIIFSTGADTSCNVFFEEGATTIFGPDYLEAVTGRGFVWRGNKHVTASTALTVTTSAAIAQSLDVQGYIQKV